MLETVIRNNDPVVMLGNELMCGFWFAMTDDKLLQEFFSVVKAVEVPVVRIFGQILSESKRGVDLFFWNS